MRRSERVTSSAARIRLSSAKTRSCATLGDARGLLAGEVARPRIELEAELGRQAHEPHRAQRVVGERARADGAQAPGGEVGRAAVRVDELAAVQRLRHRVDGEVAQREVGLERCRRAAG